MGEALPSTLDVVVLGTGLPESIVAAAATRAEFSVLHADRRDHYGGLWASFHLAALQDVLLPATTNAAAPPASSASAPPPPGRDSPGQSAQTTAQLLPLTPGTSAASSKKTRLRKQARLLEMEKRRMRRHGKKSPSWISETARLGRKKRRWS